MKSTNNFSFFLWQSAISNPSRANLRSADISRGFKTSKWSLQCLLVVYLMSIWCRFENENI